MSTALVVLGAAFVGFLVMLIWVLLTAQIRRIEALESSVKEAADAVRKFER